MSKRAAFPAVIVCSYLAGMGAALAAQPFTIYDAIRMAVETNPRVGEASANKRATQAELHQNQGTLLPQVRLEGSWGNLRTSQYDLPVAPLGNRNWQPSSRGSVVLRQLLFDGFKSINEIWRQAARVDAAAARVHEHSELTALDAAEGYIDVVRYMRLVALAQENVRAHRSILTNVQSRFEGGRAGEGDLEQTKERVDAAEAALTEFRRGLADTQAKFRRVIGVSPHNLRTPGRLRGLPTSKDRVLAVALTDNPTIKAAQGDVDAARYAFHSTAGLFVPEVSFEGRATWGDNADGYFGSYDQQSVNLVGTWDIFRGGQDAWKRKEESERYTQATMAHARLQRGAYESVDTAWNGRTITVQRISQLQSQIASDRKVISAYSKEYDLGQRSLIDLLNAENQLFNAQVSLESAKAVAVFADYQLLAAMGKLLDYLRTPHPVDAEPLVPGSFGLIPPLAPIQINLPHPGSEPLNVATPPTRPVYDATIPPQPPRPAPSRSFADRWGAVPSGSGTAVGFASEIFSTSAMKDMPHWPIKDAQAR